MKQDSPLTPSEIEEFIASLREEYRSIEQWLDNKRKEFVEQESDHGDSADVASEYEMYLKDKREVERKQERLQKIKSRLKNMTDFGYCSECGIEIEKERLKIDPTFERCIDCSDIHAIKSRNFIK